MKKIKKCVKCNEEKPLNEFDRNKDGKHGFRTYCKKCRIEIAEKNRANNQKTIYKFMANNKGQIPTDYSRIFSDKQEAMSWYEKNGKECEQKCNRKLYLAELTIQKQA